MGGTPAKSGLSCELFIADAVNGQRIRMHRFSFRIDVERGGRPIGKRLISSTPPISMTRSSNLSRPVVSVSNMISRMESPFCASFHKLRQSRARADGGLSPSILTGRRIIFRTSSLVTPKSWACIDDEIGSRRFSASGVWRSRIASSFGWRHARTVENSLTLDIGRCCHHEDLVHARFCPPSRTATECPERSVSHPGIARHRESYSPSARTSGWMIASSCFSLSGFPSRPQTVSCGRPCHPWLFRGTPLRSAEPQRRNRAGARPRRPK